MRVNFYVKAKMEYRIPEAEASETRTLADLDRALELAERLPSPDEAETSDMDLVFGEVISGWFEWFYTSTDVHGVALSSYAKHALKLRCGDTYAAHNDRIQESARQSRLFAEFRGD
jgi:predicted transcriptional regulator